MEEKIGISGQALMQKGKKEGQKEGIWKLGVDCSLVGFQDPGTSTCSLSGKKGAAYTRSSLHQGKGKIRS